MEGFFLFFIYILIVGFFWVRIWGEVYYHRWMQCDGRSGLDGVGGEKDRDTKLLGIFTKY